LLWRWLAAHFAAIRRAQLFQVAAAAVVVVWAVGWQQSIVSPQFQLCTPADMDAMAWIRRETPAQAKFFVNSFPAYANSLYAGSDCGWCVSFLAGRETNLPPILYGVEVSEQPNYVPAIYSLNSGIEQFSIATPEAARALKAAGFQYLYDGATASPGPEYNDSSLLKQSSRYQLVYDRGGVRIWKIGS